jgi:outer membrane protein assembly factor BamB
VRISKATLAAAGALALAASAALLAAPPPRQAGEEPATPLAVLWRRALPVSAANVPPQGLVATGDVVVVSGGETGLLAFGAGDGQDAWASPPVSVAPPVAAVGAIVVAGEGSVGALRPDTGERIWQRAVDGNPKALAAAGDRVAALVGGALRTWSGSGAPGWQVPLDGVATTPVLLHAGTLYVGLDSPALVAVDAASGAIVWRLPLPALPEGLAAAGDRLYLGLADGALYSYRTSGRPDPVWRFPLVRSVGQPLAGDRVVYFALLDNSVRAFDAKGGTQRWSTVVPVAPSRPVTGPLMVDRMLAVVLASGEPVEFSPLLGRVLTPPGSSSRAASSTLASRVQAAAVSVDGSRLFTVTIAKDYSRTLTAWARATR